MKIVLDTNVLVSAVLTPHGVSARVLDAVLTGAIELALDDRILDEYRQVLARPRFGLPPRAIHDLLAFLQGVAEHVVAKPATDPLPDEEDRPFLEVAQTASAMLVTGNARHFPARVRRGLQVLSPADLLALLALPRGKPSG